MFFTLWQNYGDMFYSLLYFTVWLSLWLDRFQYLINYTCGYLHIYFGLFVTLFIVIRVIEKVARENLLMYLFKEIFLLFLFIYIYYYLIIKYVSFCLFCIQKWVTCYETRTHTRTNLDLFFWLFYDDDGHIKMFSNLKELLHILS